MGEPKVTDDAAIDDIIQRLGPSLERHRGCDLFDINPGASVWSCALHDAVQPRRHIMMDAGAEQYQAFRAEMMGDRNIEVIPKSGVVWEELNKIFASHLDPSHKRLSPGEEPKRNDTLLVTANLSVFPKKKMWNFDNVATMVIYQLISSIQGASFFQRYGNVRMLIWINDENKRRVLPRAILGRKRPAFEAELACEWIHEVAGSDDLDPSTERLCLRDDWIHYESAANTLRRMEEQGIVTPKGRETSMLKAILDDPDLRNQHLAGHQIPRLRRPFYDELEDMESEDDNTGVTRDPKRLMQLRYRDKTTAKDSETYLDLLQLHDAMLKMRPTSKKFATTNADFDEYLETLKKNQRNEFFLFRDNYHIFRHNSPPALLWDRRAYEPLAVKPTEFYPNVPMCLLDVQPKTMHPVLRQLGPDSSRSGDFSNIMLRSFFNRTIHPVYPHSMDSVWPGFAETAPEHCPSLWKASAGGSPMPGHGALPVRCMNEKQWIELVQSWMRWPFRPDYYKMLGRSMEHEEIDDESELRSRATGSAN